MYQPGQLIIFFEFRSTLSYRSVFIVRFRPVGPYTFKHRFDAGGRQVTDKITADIGYRLAALWYHVSAVRNKGRNVTGAACTPSGRKTTMLPG